MTTPSEIHITIDHPATDDLVDAIIEALDEFTPRFILTAGPSDDDGSVLYHIGSSAEAQS